MASRTRAAILLLMIAVAVVLEVCAACHECSTVPSYKPPKGSAPSIGGGGEGSGAPSFGGGGGGEGSGSGAPSIGGGGGGAPSYGGGEGGKGRKKKKVYSCPVALAKLSVCSPLVGGVVGGLLPTSSGCCPLLNLLGVDVEICLCLALDANILGLISIDAPLDVIVSILTSCGYKVPHKFACPHY